MYEIDQCFKAEMDSPGLDLESCDTIEGNNLKKLEFYRS